MSARRALLLLLLLAGLAAPAGAQAPATCLGRTADEWRAEGYVVVVGTAGADRLSASWRRSVVMGLAGNDAISGSTADDILCGGDGDDVISGGGGINILVGGLGRDKLTGGAKRDMMIGGEVVDGGPAAPPPDPERPAGWYEGIAPHAGDPWAGRIYLAGRVYDCADGDGDDELREGAGGAGEELNVGTRLWGCGGDDLLDEGDGDGYLMGGPGDDTLIGGPGNDWLSGGDGVDTCDGGLHQGAVHPGGVWAAIDSAIDGSCETVANVP
jgi:hypothetical protein